MSQHTSHHCLPSLVSAKVFSFQTCHQQGITAVPGPTEQLEKPGLSGELQTGQQQWHKTSEWLCGTWEGPGHHEFMLLNNVVCHFGCEIMMEDVTLFPEWRVLLEWVGGDGGRQSSFSGKHSCDDYCVAQNPVLIPMLIPNFTLNPVVTFTLILTVLKRNMFARNTRLDSAVHYGGAILWPFKKSKLLNFGLIAPRFHDSHYCMLPCNMLWRHSFCTVSTRRCQNIV